MADIYKQLREQFTDADFLKLDDNTRLRLQAAADFAAGVLKQWPTTDDETRKNRAKHLEAQAASLASIVTSKATLPIRFAPTTPTGSVTR